MASVHTWSPSNLTSQTFFVGGACGKGKRMSELMSTFHNDFAKILEKPQSELSCGVR